MKINHTYSADTYRRQRKKSRRLLASLLSVAMLLFGGYGLAALAKDALEPSHQAASPPTSLVQGVQLAWPAVGHAAIGSTDAGLLARSSSSEEQRPTASMAKVIAAL